MKLFLITRADLTPGQQAIQGAHAIPAFHQAYPDEYHAWFTKSNILILLTVPDEATLQELSHQAQYKQIEVAEFREPDRDNELTSIALGPRGKKLAARLPMALALWA